MLKGAFDDATEARDEVIEGVVVEANGQGEAAIAVAVMESSDR